MASKDVKLSELMGGEKRKKKPKRANSYKEAKEACRG